MRERERQRKCGERSKRVHGGCSVQELEPDCYSGIRLRKRKKRGRRIEGET